jgi:hypothetical protein
MALGEAIKEDFKLITSDPVVPDGVLDLPDFSQPSCCYELPVFAELVFTKKFNNDKSSVIWFYSGAFSAVDLELEQNTGSGWSKVADLNDNTYGTFFAFGFFENNQQEKAVGYLIDWSKVLTLEGVAQYRVKTVETSLFGAANQLSFEWTLQIYRPDVVNGTTRLSWFMNGITGDPEDDQRVRDFGSLDWFNEIRLRNSLFWATTSEYEKDYVQFQNGQRVWIQDERERSYQFELNQAPNYIHELLSGEVFQADTIIITDFNADNPALKKDCSPEMLEKQVKLSSSYEPNWNFRTKLASVELTFINEFKNFMRKRC